MTHWSRRYIGIPYRDRGRHPSTGLDCWGLARVVYLEQLAIILPSYTEEYSSSEESSEVDALIENRCDGVAWSKVTDPQPFDLLIFRVGRYSTHVGIALDCRQMLHIQGDDQAKIETHTSKKYASRLMGIYRHVKAPVGRDLWPYRY